MANMCSLTFDIDCKSAAGAKRLSERFETNIDAYCEEVDEFDYIYVTCIEYDSSDSNNMNVSIDAEIKWGFRSDASIANLVNYIIMLAPVESIKIYFEESGCGLYGHITYNAGDDYITVRQLKDGKWPNEEDFDYDLDDLYQTLDELLEDDDSCDEWTINI